MAISSSPANLPDDPTLGYTPTREEEYGITTDFDPMAEERSDDPERFVSESEMSESSYLDYEGEWFDEMSDLAFKRLLGE